MPKKYVTGSCALAVLVLGVAAAATPAWAGFEWVAPPGASAASEGYAPQPVELPPVSARASSASVPPEVISPVIISGTPTPSVPIAAPFPAQMQPASPALAPLPITPPAASLPVPAAMPAPAQASSDAVVEGFASQVPLSIALRQILPVGYNYVIEANVDAATLVSYKGGQGWHTTLSDMLAPAGLVARQQGRNVTVARAGSLPAAASAPVLTPAPVASLPISSAGGPVIDSGAVRGAPTSAPVSSGAPVLMPPSRPAAQAQSATPDIRDQIDTMNMPAPIMHVPTREVPAFNVGSADGWSAERGDSLRKVLTDWCKRAGVELQWVAEYDYPMEASAHFGGSFEDAVRELLAGFESARPQPIAELHTNSGAGQKLLVVQVRGNNYAN
ncbi:MAG: TcpQ domain-containing protein [Alphaproteobacteria bacterium]|nr:TcpQ domain-containing protein [Alphaproteobacteria bacterium]